MQQTPVPASRSRLLVALLLVVGLWAVLPAGPAAAHARFEGSDPAEGAVLDALPATVVMTYSEDIAPDFVDTAVVAPGGEPVTTPATADGTDVTIDLGAADVTAGAEQAGTWQVVARVVSADGHPVEHTTTFELQPAAAPSPVPEPTAPAATTPGAEASGAGATGAAATGAATSAEVTGEATTPDETGSTSSPAPAADDATAALADGLPGWVGVVVVLAVLAAGATALVAVLRRRPPEA